MMMMKGGEASVCHLDVVLYDKRALGGPAWLGCKGASVVTEWGCRYVSKI